PLPLTVGVEAMTRSATRPMAPSATAVMTSTLRDGRRMGSNLETNGERRRSPAGRNIRPDKSNHQDTDTLWSIHPSPGTAPDGSRAGRPARPARARAADGTPTRLRLGSGTAPACPRLWILTVF